MNNLPLVSKLSTKRFSDDIILAATDNSINALSSLTNIELKIDNWIKLIIKNLNLCSFLKEKNLGKCIITIGKQKLEQVKQVRYFGVTLEEKLNWKEQVQHLCTELSKGCWALLKLRNFIDRATLKSVYYNLIYFHFQYCISSWELASTNT